MAGTGAASEVDTDVLEVGACREEDRAGSRAEVGKTTSLPPESGSEVGIGSLAEGASPEEDRAGSRVEVETTTALPPESAEGWPTLEEERWRLLLYG